jgi:hypothetical protein
VISLGTALEAFIREHEYCGEFDTPGSRTRVPSYTERIRTLEAGCRP